MTVQLKHFRELTELLGTDIGKEMKKAIGDGDVSIVAGSPKSDFSDKISNLKTTIETETPVATKKRSFS